MSWFRTVISHVTCCSKPPVSRRDLVKHPKQTSSTETTFLELGVYFNWHNSSHGRCKYFIPPPYNKGQFLGYDALMPEKQANVMTCTITVVILVQWLQSYVSRLNQSCQWCNLCRGARDKIHIICISRRTHEWACHTSFSPMPHIPSWYLIRGVDGTLDQALNHNLDIIELNSPLPTPDPAVLHCSVSADPRWFSAPSIVHSTVRECSGRRGSCPVAWAGSEVVPSGWQDFGVVPRTWQGSLVHPTGWQGCRERHESPMISAGCEGCPTFCWVTPLEAGNLGDSHSSGGKEASDLIPYSWWKNTSY